MIVDASVAVKWFLTEEFHERARALLTETEPLLAPDVLSIELASALWSKARAGDIDWAQAARAIAAVAGPHPPTLQPSLPLLERAFELARSLDHPIYDCLYLALAEARDMPLVTADGRFAALAIAHGYSRVQPLG